MTSTKRPQADDAVKAGKRASDGALVPIKSKRDPWDAEVERARAELIDAGVSVKERRGTRRAFITTGRDLLALKPPPTPWLVRGLLVSGGVQAIAAEPKNAKTWDSVELAFAIASGTPAFGHFPTMVPPSHVAIFQAEDPQRSTRAKLRALGASRGLSDAETADVAERIHVSNLEPLNLRRIDELAAIVASVRALPGHVVLLVLDPLRDLHDGDENKSDEMAEVAGALRALRTVLGCAVLFVHHSGKANENTGKRRGGQRMRGSSVLHGAVDGGLYLEAPTGNLSTEWITKAHAEIKGARSAGAFTLALRVVEDDEHDEALRVAWEVNGEGGNNDPLEIAGRRIAGVAALLEKATAPLAVRAIEAALRLRHGEATDALRDLEREGRARRKRYGWIAVPVPVPGTNGDGDGFTSMVSPAVPAAVPPKGGGDGDRNETLAPSRSLGTDGDGDEGGSNDAEPWEGIPDA